MVGGANTWLEMGEEEEEEEEEVLAPLFTISEADDTYTKNGQ